MINLIQNDVGRPVGHISSNLVSYVRLAADAKAVLDSLQPLEVEARTTEGRWCIVRIIPYRTLDNVIEGVVITFVDITAHKQIVEALRQSEEKYRVLCESNSKACRHEPG
jgi:two-component system CheB/CheR fusion protein